ncbi:MAG TPA: helix-turn-helix transcriptional regulator [Thermoleophilaceae bacterium]|nr:helix-turn-helix transcriptional regulator [Thermoleophilaceae bacterium]
MRQGPNPRPGAPNHDLLRARARKHLSIDALGRMSGVSGKTIRDIEKGRVRNPHMETQARLARALQYEDPLDLFRPERNA